MRKSSLLPIESLEKKLRGRFPDATITMDRPKNRSGTWFLDVSVGQGPVVIQWRPDAGFGVSSPAHAYGMGTDEVYPDEEATYGRALSLLLSGGATSPPEAIRLRELRQERGISQAELAEILKKQQGEISKIERRRDVKLSTLRDYIRSIGGTLQVLARLPEGSVRVIEIDDGDQKKGGRKKMADAKRASSVSRKR